MKIESEFEVKYNADFKQKKDRLDVLKLQKQYESDIYDNAIQYLMKRMEDDKEGQQPLRHRRVATATQCEQPQTGPER